MTIMAVGQNFKAFAVLFSVLSLSFLLNNHIIVEAAPTTAINEGATQSSPTTDDITSPIPGLGSTATTNSLNPAEKPTCTTTTEPPPTTVDEERVSSTIPNEINSPQNDNMDTDTQPGRSRVASPGFLLYEVQRDVLGLSLDDIGYVLELGPEVFSYSLADKLGYLTTERSEDDPHISVIEANKEQLMKKLESQREGLTKSKEESPISQATENPVSQEPITTTPTPSQKASKDFSRGKFAYDVVIGLRDLSLETIDRLLSFDSELGSLPYAINHELGFKDDESDPHFLYLIGEGDGVLREALRREKQRKLNETQMTEKNSASQPEQGARVNVHVSKRPEDMPQTTEMLKITKAEELIMTTTHEPVSTEVPHRNEETPSTRPNNEDSSSHDITIALPNKPTKDSEKPSDVYDDELGDLFEQMLKDNKFLTILYDEDKELYLKLEQAELDDETATKLLDRYEEWLDGDYNEAEYGEYNGEQVEPSGGELGAEGEGQEVKPKVGQEEEQVNDGDEEKVEMEGEAVQPDGEGDGNIEEIIDEEEDVVYYDDNEPSGSSSFGALHFLTIFILIGAAVVIGYLCLHNRKKIREGVGSYIADASKRRRRAREYKPVKQAIDDRPVKTRSN